MERQTIDTQIEPTPSEVSAVAAPLQDAWRRTWLAWPVAVASESLRFTAHRLRAHSHYYGALHNCVSVPELIEANSDFVRTAFNDYSAEASKVMKDSARHTPSA